MRYKKFLLGVIASMLCLGLLNGCGHEDEISIKIETYLQEEYGEEFEVLSWNQPKLLPSDNGAIYATCVINKQKYQICICIACERRARMARRFRARRSSSLRPPQTP